MVDTIIFHHPEDAERAVWLMRSLDDRQAVTLPVQANAPRLQFGDHVLVIGIWGAVAGQGGREMLEQLVRMITPAKQRGILLVWDDPAASAAAARLGVSSVAATGQHEEDLKLVRNIARAMEQGEIITSKHIAARAPAAAGAGRAPSRNVSPRREGDAPGSNVSSIRGGRIAPANDADNISYDRRQDAPVRPARSRGRPILWVGVIVGLLAGGAGAYWAVRMNGAATLIAMTQKAAVVKSALAAHSAATPATIPAAIPPPKVVSAAVPASTSPAPAALESSAAPEAAPGVIDVSPPAVSSKPAASSTPAISAAPPRVVVLSAAPPQATTSSAAPSKAVVLSAASPLSGSAPATTSAAPPVKKPAKAKPPAAKLPSPAPKGPSGPDL